MTEVVKEYGSAVLAVLGGILLLGTVGQMLFSEHGLLVQMIAAWGNGGC
ncbi:MAG: hypothetical protein PUA77_04815 [Lachnospiraceae bacterium]|nr:hypothetical protein [Agathobacter sp.]MDD6291097.1 hypothetical protein [Lachnospiraceae bacterium]